MSGAIIVSKTKSFDVRTIDFVRIVDVFRSFMTRSEIATKLLETVDEFGMNMICADELDSADFTNFAQLMREVRAAIGDEDPGLADFLDSVSESINADERLAH